MWEWVRAVPLDLIVGFDVYVIKRRGVAYLRYLLLIGFILTSVRFGCCAAAHTGTVAACPAGQQTCFLSAITVWFNCRSEKELHPVTKAN